MNNCGMCEEGLDFPHGSHCPEQYNQLNPEGTPVNYKLIQNLGLAAAAFILFSLLAYSAMDAYEGRQQLETCQEAVELADEIIQHAGDGLEAVGRNDFRDVQDTANDIDRVGPDYRDARTECLES